MYKKFLEFFNYEHFDDYIVQGNYFVKYFGNFGVSSKKRAKWIKERHKLS